MDKKEARTILSGALGDYRKRSYAELQSLLKTTETSEVRSPAGKLYQLEFYAVWDNKPNNNLRVIGTIDDGSFFWAMFPMGNSFIMAPDGRFVGE